MFILLTSVILSSSVAPSLNLGGGGCRFVSLGRVEKMALSSFNPYLSEFKLTNLHEFANSISSFSL